MNKYKKQIWVIALIVAILGLLWNGASIRFETEGLEIELKLFPAKSYIKKPETKRFGYESKMDKHQSNSQYKYITKTCNYGQTLS